MHTVVDDRIKMEGRNHYTYAHIGQHMHRY